MTLYENLKMALKAVIANKMRSILTMLGIIIGISSVITMVSLGRGSQERMKGEFEALGANKAYIYINGDEDYNESHNIREQDIHALERIYGNEVKAITPDLYNEGQVLVGKKAMSVNVKGVTEDHQQIEKFQMIRGRFFAESDMTPENSAIIISEKMAEKIFKSTDVIGKRFVLMNDTRNYNYVVTGVYSKVGSTMGTVETLEAMAPVPAVARQTDTDSYYAIEFGIEDGVDSQLILKRMVRLIEKKHGTIGKDNYIAFNAEKEMASLNRFMNMMTLFISAIAGISLLVGGIGIMNIMLVSVTERTREIGIRKAIGANNINIMTQFLIESIIISGIGGIIGIVSGYSMANLIGRLAKITPLVNMDVVLIALGFCFFIGVFFGLYPARRAAKLHPIDALRYE